MSNKVIPARTMQTNDPKNFVIDFLLANIFLNLFK